MADSVSSSTSKPADSATIGSQLATAIGGGTGMDMTALATTIAQAEFAGRISNLDNKSTKLETSISQASQLKSNLQSLSSSLGTLVRSGSLAATPSVANSTIATASLPPGSSGVTSSYSLEVINLASPQVLNSPAYPSSAAAVGSGTLTLTFGSLAGSSFTADSARSPVNITIAAGATLADVATAINGSGAGVTAYVANAADGAHLVLKGQTGASQAFTLGATESPTDPGLAALAWEPASGDGARLAAAAKDASFKLDGIARSAPGNTVANAAPGLSLTLTGTNPGQPTTVSFSDPTSNIGSAMTDLVSALNSVMGQFKEALDPASGGLAQDPATRAARARLLQLTSTTVMPNATGTDPKTLSDLGMSIDKNGNFTLDNTRLSNALAANPKGVAAMFTTGLYGVYATVDGLTRNLTSSGTAGSIGGAIDKYTKLKSTLADQRSQLVAQQDKVRSRLVSQYASANSLVAGSKSTLTYLQNQIAAWNKN